MLEKIMLLIGSSADDEDELITLLINNAKAFLLLYCGLSEYSSDYDTIIIRMVLEDWNRRGSEGIASRSFSGLSESFSSDSAYSEVVMAMLDQCASSYGSKGRIKLL